MQSLTVRHLVGAVGGGLAGDVREAGEAAIVAAFRAVLADEALDDLMRGELMILPAEAYLAEQFAACDPQAIRTAREALKARQTVQCGQPLVAIYFQFGGATDIHPVKLIGQPH